MEIEIAPARVEDVPLLRAMIQELAAYERLQHEVVATDEDLRETLFGARPRAEVLIARKGFEEAGFALFFHNYSTFLGKPGLYIEDLFVRPRFRRRGIGRALFHHLAALAATRRSGRMEWAVLDWNEDAIRFYRSLGAKPLSDWTVYRLTGGSLEALLEKPLPEPLEQR